MPFADTVVLVLTFINIILTAILVGVFYKNHRLVRSKMTLGMLFFAAAFLLENILNFYFYDSLLAAGIVGLTLFHLAVAFIEMAGLLVLLYITWK
jgi:hypothetical protein